MYLFIFFPLGDIYVFWSNSVWGVLVLKHPSDAKMQTFFFFFYSAVQVRIREPYAPKHIYMHFSSDHTQCSYNRARDQSSQTCCKHHLWFLLKRSFFWTFERLYILETRSKWKTIMSNMSPTGLYARWYFFLMQSQSATVDSKLVTAHYYHFRCINE